MLDKFLVEVDHVEATGVRQVPCGRVRFEWFPEARVLLKVIEEIPGDGSVGFGERFDGVERGIIEELDPELCHR